MSTIDPALVDQVAAVLRIQFGERSVSAEEVTSWALELAAPVIEAAALERAAEVCSARAVMDRYASDYEEGLRDGAERCENDIRALIPSGAGGCKETK